MTMPMKDDVLTPTTKRAIDDEKVYARIDDLLERRDQTVDIEAWLRATNRNVEDLTELLAVAIEVIYQAQG